MSADVDRPDEDALRSDLVETCRAMARKGLSQGTSGNVSVRFRDGFLVSPTGVDYDALTPDVVVRMRMDGGFDGAVLPSSEWRFHRDILAGRPDLHAVVHTHSTYATALAVMGLAIPPIHYGMAAAGGPDIRCARYATFGTQELADAVMEALEGRRACLLAHHGAVVGHATLARALDLAVLVEEMARLFVLCRSLGTPPLLGEDEIARVLEKHETYGQQPRRLD